MNATTTTTTQPFRTRTYPTRPFGRRHVGLSLAGWYLGALVAAIVSAVS